MSFLRINGWPVPVAPGTVTQRRAVGGVDARSEQNDPIFSRRRQLLEWEAQQVLVRAEDADAVEGIVAGNGHRMPFDANLFSTRGRGPLSTAGAGIVAGGIFGGFCANVTSLVYDLARGPAPLLDRWTVMVFREEAAVFRHYVVRSDGAVFFDGVRNDLLVVAAWLSVFDGFVALIGVPTRFDELVVLGFTATDEQCSAWSDRMRLERIPFSSLPRLDADGDLFGSRSVEVIGIVDKPQDHVPFGSSLANPDETTFWRNNGRRVPFVLVQARRQPVVEVPTPLVAFTFDSAYYAPPGLPPVDMAQPRNTTALTGAPTSTAEGQAAQALTLAGGLDGVSLTSGVFDRSDTDPFGIAAVVRVSSAAVVGVAMALYAKINPAVTPGLWLNLTLSVTGLVTVDVHLRNIAGTLGRRVSFINAFRPDEWHHVVATYDGRADASGMALFVDGSRVGAITQNTAPGATANAVLPRIGRAEVGAALLGDVDGAGFWTTALSAADAQALFLAASRRLPSPFQAE